MQSAWARALITTNHARSEVRYDNGLVSLPLRARLACPGCHGRQTSYLPWLRCAFGSKRLSLLHARQRRGLQSRDFGLIAVSISRSARTFIPTPISSSQSSKIAVSSVPLAWRKLKTLLVPGPYPWPEELANVERWLGEMPKDAHIELYTLVGTKEDGPILGRLKVTSDMKISLVSGALL